MPDGCMHYCSLLTCCCVLHGCSSGACARGRLSSAVRLPASHAVCSQLLVDSSLLYQRPAFICFLASCLVHSFRCMLCEPQGASHPLGHVSGLEMCSRAVPARVRACDWPCPALPSPHTHQQICTRTRMSTRIAQLVGGEGGHQIKPSYSVDGWWRGTTPMT